MTKMLPEAERLHAIGFAIHWLRPNSKIPVESGWTKGPRALLKDLKRTYKSSYNMGVRLGKVSEINGSYLAVVDLDVKADDPRYRTEAENALFKIFPQCRQGPFILSGRGNGSSHYYVRVKEPTRANELKAASKEIIKVFMPSAPVSEKESQTLSFEDQEKGFRLRRAWEISLLCEGRQAVLAGSVHPDTGATYKWGREITNGEDIPLIDLGIEALKTCEVPSDLNDTPLLATEWTFKEVDVDSLGLKSDHLEALKTGKDVEDRSAKVYELILAMLSRNISDETIISVLTDRDHYLGQTAYSHAKSSSRRKAARWLERYCLIKARSKMNTSDFDIEEVPEDLVSDKKLNEDRQKSRRAIRDNMPRELMWPVGFSKNPDSWESELELKFRGKSMAPLVIPSYGNLKLILSNSCDFPDFLRFDQFSQRGSYVCDTPWGNKKGDERSAGSEDALKLKNWLYEKYLMTPSLRTLDEQLNFQISYNAFHPVQDYLNRLNNDCVWDNEPRIETAFKKYMGADMPEPYLSQVSRKFFIGCVERIFNPGCQFQYMVVLEGPQGIGKSTFGRILAGEEWFIDGLPNFQDKDAALNLVGIWIAEISELAALNRSDNQSAKAFITRTTDKIRPPYGARRISYRRSSIFLGTTNHRDYLNDPTGKPTILASVDYSVRF